MAAEDEDPLKFMDDREACFACRTIGVVSSGKGGEPHDVPCPWCDGSGRFQPGHDAQAARRTQT